QRSAASAPAWTSSTSTRRTTCRWRCISCNAGATSASTNTAARWRTACACCAVALRFAVEEGLGPGGVELAEAQDIVGMLAELPDLWDVNLAAWYNDSVPSRFAAEGAQEPFIAFVKKTTSKPVVGVGRFTSPDTMVSQLRRGVLDLIGCARPSIADPFL